MYITYICINATNTNRRYFVRCKKSWNRIKIRISIMYTLCSVCTNGLEGEWNLIAKSEITFLIEAVLPFPTTEPEDTQTHYKIQIKANGIEGNSEKNLIFTKW